jgi:ABC-type proline/glycine betaine transport system ATPase subunit/ABC-type proline/glycine betaine transport system permease subunit
MNRMVTERDAASAGPATDTTLAVECRDVWKLFGRGADQALAALKAEGLDKNEVLSRLKCVVGVAGVSFGVRRGEVFCIMGLSGSGKSTLVRHINRLIQPTAGQVLIDGKDIGGVSAAAMRRLRAEKIGMVFQNFALLPHRTVIENVAFGLELRDESRERRLGAAAKMLDLVKLGDWAHHWPDQLSGGMQQRVGLARALAGDPDILLMDEPFGALDPLIRRQLQEQFLEISRVMRKTTIFITHDLDEAIRLGGRIAIMRDGRIVQIGTPSEIVHSPVDAYVAEFVSGTSRLKLIRAGDILRPATGPVLPDWPRTGAASDLERLIDLAIARDVPTVVVDEADEPVGVVDRESLLRSLRGIGSPAQMPSASPALPAEAAPGSALAVGPIEAAQRAGFSLPALLAGPVWAAYHGLWPLFAAVMFGDIVALALLGRGLLAPDGEIAAQDWLLAGAVLFAVIRLSLAASAEWARDLAARRRRADPAAHARGAPRRSLWSAAFLVFTYLLTLYRFVVPEPPAVLAAFPVPKGLDTGTAKAIDVAVDWMKRNWVDFFDALTASLRSTLNFVELVFVATPWPVVAACCLAIAWRLSGRGVAIFTGASLAYLGLLGFWEKSMSTMALIATSVLICVAIGIPVGVLCAKSRRVNAAMEPILDVMQTLPTFVYLIPAVAFFSIGKPPGVIATVIFALPPMIRLTALGIRQVPPQVREAAEAFGARPAQMLFKVELPLAVPSIRLGVNQTIMMSLSMVVIAAMIGAGGLGLDVIRSLQHLKTGQGVLAGIAIVLCAMVLDRMVRGQDPRRGDGDR